MVRPVVWGPEGPEWEPAERWGCPGVMAESGAPAAMGRPAESEREAPERGWAGMRTWTLT